MGVLSKILSKGPGGPASIAKAVLTEYNIYLSENPRCPSTEALQHVICSRYHPSKKMGLFEIGYYLGHVQSVGDLITIMIYNENPLAFSRKFLSDTLVELENFYKKMAPEQLKTIPNIPNMIAVVHAFRSAGEPFQNQHLQEREKETTLIEEASLIEMNEIKYLSLAFSTSVIEADEDSSYNALSSLLPKNTQSKEIATCVENYLHEICMGNTNNAIDVIKRILPHSSHPDAVNAHLRAISNFFIQGEERRAAEHLEILFSKYIYQISEE